MLKEVKGDLLAMAMSNDFDVIIHGCNCFHTMGGGIARSIRDTFPEAYRADRINSIYGDKAKLGTFTSAMINRPEDGIHFTIVNAYTQYSMAMKGEDVFEYEAFDDVLHLVNRVFPGMRIGIPLVGCGLAGGGEPRIRAIMEKHAERMDLTLVVFQP
jgi:O-acetyl-ADP-ribose deacetylase (regulator of RNase III)